MSEQHTEERQAWNARVSRIVMSALEANNMNIEQTATDLTYAFAALVGVMAKDETLDDTIKAGQFHFERIVRETKKASNELGGIEAYMAQYKEEHP